MDDLKSKVLDLIKHKSQTRVPIIGGLEDFSALSNPSCEEPVEPIQKEPEQPSDQEILDSIEQQYFSNNADFDASRYELEKVVELSDLEEMEKSLRRLKQQHTVVSNQVLQMILEKQTATQQEFNRVVELESLVGDAKTVVVEGRQRLAMAATCITTASLAILTNSRRKSLMAKLLRSLHSIAALRQIERDGEERMSCGDVEGGVRLMAETLRAAGSYKHFTCVASLSNKLQDNLIMAEEHLDQLMANICYNFDEGIYSQIDSAYSVLGKSQAAMDQLLMHYASAVHNTAYSSVKQFVQAQYSSKPDYKQLCKMIEEDKFIECLVSLCKSLWGILLSYYQLLNWTVTKSYSNSGKFEGGNFVDEYRRQKLEGGKGRLWHDVQAKVSCLVLSVSLANYKFDDFLHVLALLHRLSQIGDELCGESSVEELASSIKTQSQAYFLRYHASRLDDLRAFLDNEPWTPCPISKYFNFLHLQEWRGLRSAVEKCGGISKTKRQSQSDASSLDASSSTGGDRGLFTSYLHPNIATPFDNPPATLSETCDDSVSGYSSDDSVDDSHSEGETMLVSNTTLTVLRLCGKYLQMVKYLDSIVVEVVAALCQLFEYYLYTVHNLFTSQLSEWCVSPSIKLQAVLKRIKESLINGNENQAMVLEAEGMVHHLVGSNLEESLEARTVAVESLVFLSAQYHLLRPYLEQLLSNNNSSLHKLNQFYTQTVGVSGDVRGPVYSNVVASFINTKQALDMMSKVDWELKDVMDQHSSYVDILFSEVEQMHSSLVRMRIGGISPLPKLVISSLWDSLSYLLANLFVEGFSSSRKCSNGGRGLMQLDWEQFKSKVAKICPLRPIPYATFVETYIKAYYQPEQEMLAWIKLHHSEYSSKQMVALVCSACQSDRKSRLRLTSALEEIMTDHSTSPIPR